MLFLGRMIGNRNSRLIVDVVGSTEIRFRSLKISVGMYFIGTIASLSMLMYKMDQLFAFIQISQGIHMIVIVPRGTLHFVDVQDDLFGGSIGTLFHNTFPHNTRITQCLIHNCSQLNGK